MKRSPFVLNYFNIRSIFSVREKAKQLVTLLKDDDRLKSERKKALQAKERFAQNSTGIGSTNSKIPKASGTLGG